MLLKKKIHINQHIVKSNKKNGTDLPCITVKTYKSNQYANKVTIKGEAVVISQPTNPLPCGATVWIETRGEVTIDLWSDEIHNIEGHRVRMKYVKTQPDRYVSRTILK